MPRTRSPSARDPEPRRPQWTIKGAEMTPELRALASKAAAKGGQTQSAFVAQVVTRAAQARLKGEEEGGPLPVVVPPVLEARLAAQEAAQALQAVTLQAALEAAQEARRLGEEARDRQEAVQAALDELTRRAGQEERRGLLGLLRGRR